MTNFLLIFNILYYTISTKVWTLFERAGTHLYDPVSLVEVGRRGWVTQPVSTRVFFRFCEGAKLTKNRETFENATSMRHELSKL